MFLCVLWETFVSLNINGGLGIFFDFFVKITYWAYLIESGLKPVSIAKPIQVSSLSPYSNRCQGYKCHELQKMEKYYQ